MRGHALIIAIASYPNVPPLPSAVINDARDMTDVLTSSAHCGYGLKNVTSLIDHEATLEAIRRELKDLAGRVQPNDTAVIFFSGHGVRLGDLDDVESALVPVDCEEDDIPTTTLSESEFSAALAGINARRIVVIIDACHSGAAGSFKWIKSTPNLGFGEKSLGRLAQGAGRVLIASSRASETSLVFAGARNSLFTHHLLDALRGGARTHGDGLIRVFEIFNYVAEKVRGAAPGRQHPIFKASDLEDNFPVALDRGGAKKKGSEISVGAERVWRRLEEILADLYPAGPQDQEIWARAGGDVSRLRLKGTGRANWFAALRTMQQGGGGLNINRSKLIRAALEDFPHQQELSRLSEDGI